MDYLGQLEQIRYRKNIRQVAHKVGTSAFFLKDGASWIAVSGRMNVDGGPGSGNFNHKGRAGQIGGSAPGNGSRAVVQGKDISGTYSGNTDIHSVLKVQGFDGLPKIVKKAEFDEAVKNSSFIAQRTYSASSDEILEAYRDMLYNGDFYVDCSVGGSQYGKGMYCAADYSGNLSDGIKSEMKHYRELGQTRALGQILSDERKKITKKFFDESPYTKNENISEDEVRIFLKLKNDKSLTGFKLPPEEKKIWQSMIETKHMQSMNLALSDKENSVSENYKAPSFTETITLDPSAKVASYSGLQQEIANAGKRYLEKKLRKYEETASPECKIFFDVQQGRGHVSSEDFGRLMKWSAAHPEECNAAENFRQNAIKEATEVQNKCQNIDIGAYAALQGYDAINASDHGESGSYTVILNRTKCLFLDPADDERKDSTDEGSITFQISDDGLIYAIRDGKVIGWVYVQSGSKKS